jgi:hypothetical protein
MPSSCLLLHKAGASWAVVLLVKTRMQTLHCMLGNGSSEFFVIAHLNLISILRMRVNSTWPDNIRVSSWKRILFKKLWVWVRQN